MPRFAYDATDADGRRRSGEIEAEDRRAAARRLAAMRLGVSRLEPLGGASRAASADEHPALRRPRHFGAHPVAVAFIGGFVELHEGGMPAGDAVRLMTARVTEPALRSLCRALWRDLSEGAPLAAAMAKHPVVFDEASVRLVEAGETTGELAPVLRRVAESYERRETLRARVLAALGYPCLLMLMAGAVLTLFVFVIMPVMERMMTALGGGFPWHVRALMAGAVLLVKGAPILVPLVLLIIFRIRKARTDEAVRRRQDALALRTPLLGPPLRHAEAARLADLLATLLGSGVNAAQALRLAEKPIANSALRARFSEARRRVHDGASISAALRDTGILDTEDTDLVAVGEQAGALPRAFAAVAERRRRALDASIAAGVRWFTGVFLGGVVGLVFFCLVTIVTTILSVSQNISTHR